MHQNGACIRPDIRHCAGRSRGGLTTKIHAVMDRQELPLRLALSGGQEHDSLNGLLLSRRCARRETPHARPRSDSSVLLRCAAPVMRGCRLGRMVFPEGNLTRRAAGHDRLAPLELRAKIANYPSWTTH